MQRLFDHNLKLNEKLHNNEAETNDKSQMTLEEEEDANISRALQCIEDEKIAQTLQRLDDAKPAIKSKNTNTEEVAIAEAIQISLAEAEKIKIENLDKEQKSIQAYFDYQLRLSAIKKHVHLTDSEDDLCTNDPDDDDESDIAETYPSGPRLG